MSRHLYCWFLLSILLFWLGCARAEMSNYGTSQGHTGGHAASAQHAEALNHAYHAYRQHGQEYGVNPGQQQQQGEEGGNKENENDDREVLRYFDEADVDPSAARQAQGMSSSGGEGREHPHREHYGYYAHENMHHQYRYHAHDKENAEKGKNKQLTNDDDDGEERETKYEYQPHDYNLETTNNFAMPPAGP